ADGPRDAGRGESLRDARKREGRVAELGAEGEPPGQERRPFDERCALDAHPSAARGKALGAGEELNRIRGEPAAESARREPDDLGGQRSGAEQKEPLEAVVTIRFARRQREPARGPDRPDGPPFLRA